MFGPLGSFFGWVSLQPHDWLDLHEALQAHRYYSPINALCLFGRYGKLERALEMLNLDEPLAFSEVVAKWPVHEGFIASVELVPTGYDHARAAVMAFLQREQQRDTEAWLRECYGNADGFEHDIRFYGMDYPTFDNGTVASEYGLMIDRDNRRWLWSRAAFYHK
jgi:hypothetical protein